MLQFKTSRRQAWLVFLVVLSLVAIVSGGGQSAEAATIALANLFGPWQMTLISVAGGCGPGTALVTFTLDANGMATDAIEVSHSVGCGDTVLSGQTFQIISLNPNGSGVAGLSCGIGCGFTFAIQVAPGGTIFNLVDVTDPGNSLEGVAIHQ